MLAHGTTELIAFVPLFIAAVVLLVAVLVAGHVSAALCRRPEDPDERDRLIAWRAESRSSWIVATGVVTGITGMVLSFDNVWIANLLMLSMLLSEVTRCILKLVDYRRGR